MVDCPFHVSSPSKWSVTGGVLFSLISPFVSLFPFPFFSDPPSSQPAERTALQFDCSSALKFVRVQAEAYDPRTEQGRDETARNPFPRPQPADIRRRCCSASQPASAAVCRHGAVAALLLAIILAITFTLAITLPLARALAAAVADAVAVALAGEFASPVSFPLERRDQRAN